MIVDKSDFMNTCFQLLVGLCPVVLSLCYSYSEWAVLSYVLVLMILCRQC